MIATTLALTGWLTLLCHADPELPAPLPKLQRIDFSADHPETWPRTNPPLEAVPREEFDRLWSKLQPVRSAQPAVVLERAVYQASLVNDRLQGGTFTAEVHRTSPTAAWLKWSPFNLALSDLRWQDGPAVFGADSQGEHWLLADRKRRVLIGAWTRLGRRIGRQTEFQIEVPESISTTLVLKIPRDLELRCQDSTIPLESGPASGAWATWRVDLGSRTRATLVVRSVEDGVPLTPVITYRKQLSAELGEDHLRFQIGFSAEVLNAPVTELDFTLPKAVELYSVNYGADTLLRWTRVSEDGNRLRIRVTLPDALQGELRPLRLEGLLPRRPNATVVIP
ncbi:MAG TPA: hypothetical protein VFG20_04575, partial [Planctomycetaceae bacterium]|nr:hypothetical protein [Planctomycetaceae bacterium]